MDRTSGTPSASRVTTTATRFDAPADDAAPSRPAPGIQAGLLMPHDRVAREPLGRWSDRLRSHLGEAAGLPDPARAARAVGGVANNAALISVHRGDTVSARRLCHEQIAWQVRASHAADDPRIAANAVQPWVNLGRLAVLEGRLDAGLSHFADLFERRHKARLHLGDARIELDPAGPEGAEGADTVRQLIETVYVLDSLRALLLSGRFEATTDFCRRARHGADPTLEPFITEAEVVATGRLGEPVSAARAAAAATRTTRGWQRLVFVLRRAESTASTGAIASARRLLRGIESVLSSSPLGVVRMPANLPILVRVAAACGEASLDAEAERMAAWGLTAARAAEDEVFEIQCLRQLAALNGSAKGARCKPRLAHLEEATGYRRYRRVPGHSPDDASVDALVAELSSFLTSDVPRPRATG